MTSGYPRFKREILKAKQLGIQLILGIEGSLTQVYHGVEHSDFEGASCVKKLYTLACKYSLYPVFARTRQELAWHIRESFEAIGRLTK